MDKKTGIMSMIVVLMFIPILVGINMKQTVAEKNEQNWKFGDWKQTPTEPIVENKIEKPVEEPIKKDEQIVAKSYDEALKLAKDKNMSIFIFFYSDHCSWCDKMKSTLNDEDVKKELKKYVYLTVNAATDNSLKEKYKIRGVPQLTIIDANEKVQKSKTGYVNEKSLSNWLK